MREYNASCIRGSSSWWGRGFGDPFRRLQEVPRLFQAHGFDHRLPAPEIGRDDPRLV
jgi:hypothetical protein